MSGQATEGGASTFTFANRAENAASLVLGGIEISNLSGEIHGSRNCISLGIKPEAVESPIWRGNSAPFPAGWLRREDLT